MRDSVISAVALNSHCSDSMDRGWVRLMAMLIDAKHVVVAKCVRNCSDSPCWRCCSRCIAVVAVAVVAAASTMAANLFAYNGHSGKCIRLNPANSLVASAHKHHFDLHSADDRTLVANLPKKKQSERKKKNKKNVSPPKSHPYKLLEIVHERRMLLRITSDVGR